MYSMFSKMRLFQKTATGIFIIFMGIIILVIIVAHSRPSGATKQDMSFAQMIRKQTHSKKQIQFEITEKSTDEIN